MDRHERYRGLRRLVNRSATIVACILSALVPNIQLAHADEDVRAYQFGVHPYVVPRAMAVAYGPATLDLSEKLRHPVRLLTTTSFDKYADKLRRREYDIAIVQPFDFSRVVEEFGYVPVARVNAQLRGLFVVLADSDLKSVTDLAGRRVAMAPRDAATSRLALWTFADSGLEPGKDITVDFLNTHDACLQEVLRGAAAVCVTAPPPMEDFMRRTGAKMRVLAMTDPLPYMAAVVHPRLPVEQREAVRKTMMEWTGSSKGRAILAAMGFPGWTDIKDGDYAEIERRTEQEEVAATDGSGLLFGTFPYFNPRRVAAHLAPLTEQLAVFLKMPVHLRTTTSYEQFESNLRAQKYDLALINPFEFTLAREADYEPVVRFGDDWQGQVYVKVDSKIADVQGLRGTTVATPAPTAMFTLLALAHLRSRGLEPGRDVQIDHRASHDSCVERVLKGNAAACVTPAITMEQIPEAQSVQLRAIDQTISVPGLALVIQRRHYAAFGASLRQELLSWSSRPEQRAALKHMGLGDFVAVDVDAYRALPEQR